VCSIGSPCYLKGFLQKILNHLAGHTELFVRNSENFIEILDRFKVRVTDILVSFDVVSLFTDVPVNEATSHQKQTQS
jgi:hypothetical protein